jgi:hypothetical protein
MIRKYQKILIWNKEKNKKNLIFFDSVFKMQKQMGPTNNICTQLL